MQNPQIPDFYLANQETGLVLTLRVFGSKSPAQKLLASSLVGPENFVQICKTSQKLQHLFVEMLGRTDTRTTKLLTIIREIFLHMCEAEGEKLQTLQNFYLFTL